MKIAQKLLILRRLTDERILPLITADYMLLGLPYYENPGDTLIWEGTLEMLKKCPYQCVQTYGCGRCKYVPQGKETVIIVLGGGFFGDLWRPGWQNVMNVISHYPDNPIVILPQSIFYKNEMTLNKDAKVLKTLKKLTICVRDTKSFEFANKQFGGDVRLAPDMAFYANVERFRQSLPPTTTNGRRLYLLRQDQESNEHGVNIVGEDVDCQDWPTMSGQRPRSLKRISKIVKFLKKHMSVVVGEKMETILYRRFAKDILLRSAVEFLNPYNEVYSTRLHGALLSTLLGKRVFAIDNNYGKISGCLELWLNDCDNCTIL